MHTRRGLMIFTLTMAVALAACGGDDGDGGGEGDSAAPTTQPAELSSCTVVTPEEVEAALGVSGVTPEDPAQGDCLWEADQEGSVLNTRLDPPSERINLSVLLDETTVTVPGGDQAVYDTVAQCLEGVANDQRMRICVFTDDGDPQAAAEAVWNAAIARL